MEKILQTFRYLIKGFTGLTIIGYLGILGTVAITDLVFFLTGRNALVHPIVSLPTPFEFTAGICALLIGLILIIPNFKVALSNGISRKTFIIANLPSAVIAAFALSIFNLIVVVVHGFFWPIQFLGKMFFPDADLFSLLILQFTLYLLMTILGWSISMAYYRSIVLVKWIISFAPFVIYELLRVIDAFSGGATFTSIHDFLRIATRNPYTTAISFLSLSVIMFVVNYLLIRRAPLKD